MGRRHTLMALATAGATLAAAPMLMAGSPTTRPGRSKTGTLTPTMQARLREWVQLPDRTDTALSFRAGGRTAVQTEPAPTFRRAVVVGGVTSTDLSGDVVPAWPRPLEVGCTTRARVDGQNAQKAKIARYAGCEHNRDAVRADP